MTAVIIHTSRRRGCACDRHVPLTCLLQEHPTKFWQDFPAVLNILYISTFSDWLLPVTINNAHMAISFSAPEQASYDEVNTPGVA